MPKKGKKKGKKKKAKKEKEYLPPIYQIPEYDPPDKIIPKVDIIIRLAVPPNELLFKKIEQVPINTRVQYIEKIIKQMHQGAISNITICRDRYNPEEALDPLKTLEQSGILGEGGEVKLLYDFKPVTNPLLF